MTTIQHTQTNHAAATQSASSSSPGTLGQIATDLQDINGAINPLAAAAGNVAQGINALNPATWLQALSPTNLIKDFVDNPAFKDIWERLALILFGAILIIIGVLRFTQTDKVVVQAAQTYATKGK